MKYLIIEAENLEVLSSDIFPILSTHDSLSESLDHLHDLILSNPKTKFHIFKQVL